jgi:hypothetical protein
VRTRQWGLLCSLSLMACEKCEALLLPPASAHEVQPEVANRAIDLRMSEDGIVGRSAKAVLLQDGAETNEIWLSFSSLSAEVERAFLKFLVPISWECLGQFWIASPLGALGWPSYFTGNLGHVEAPPPSVRVGVRAIPDLRGGVRDGRIVICAHATELGRVFCWLSQDGGARTLQGQCPTALDPLRAD